MVMDGGAAARSGAGTAGDTPSAGVTGIVGTACAPAESGGVPGVAATSPVITST